MPTHGLHSAKNCINQASERLENSNLPESVKITIRVIAGILPAVIGSFFPFQLTPVFVFASIFAVYRAAKPIQGRIFELGARERYWHVSVPISFFFLSWALCLAMTGQANQISRSVGAMAMVSAAALWPVYMGKKAYRQKKRKVPFSAVYAVVSAIVVLQQILIIWGNFQ